ncbi:superoxide dismutase [Candidatus Microgenomates bacterium]|nr:MAG: superoxide dismutase [Candidatus Microgenomates bacterium]
MYKLPDLPFSYSALEPYIDARTMEIHHTKHHAGYVEKLNKALENHTDLQKLSIKELLSKSDDLPDSIRQSVVNNGGGHANHSMFWTILSPNPKSETRLPGGGLLEAINVGFGSFEDFKKAFSEKALSLFGSGWVFLIKNAKGDLSIKRHSFQNTPLMYGVSPLMGLDVWEHAYYLKYQNRRAEYIDAFWNVVNWEEVAKALAA